MKIRNQQDFWSGVMFTLVGLFFSGLATQYNMGTAARMGAGYFPFYLGLVLIGIGLIVMVKAVSLKAEETKVDRFDFKTLLLILGAVVLFGICLKWLGLFIALLVLIVVSSYASHEFTLKGTLINVVVMSALCYGLFIYALKLQFPLWPWFIR